MSKDGRERDDYAIAELLASVGGRIADPSEDVPDDSPCMTDMERLPQRPTEREAIAAHAVLHTPSGQVWSALAEAGACLLAAGLTEGQWRKLPDRVIEAAISRILDSGEHVVGYLTNRGRFVDPERAFRIAWNARQLRVTGQLPQLGQYGEGELVWLPAENSPQA